MRKYHAKGTPGGAKNYDGNKRSDRGEYFPFQVNGTLYVSLPALKGQEGIIHVSGRTTTVATELKRTGNNTIVATVKNGNVARVNHFGMRVSEGASPEAMWARVVTTPKGGVLPEKKLTTDRDGQPWLDRYDQIVWQGLSHCAVVTSRGQNGKFFVSTVGFGQDSKRDTSITIEEKFYTLNMPPELSQRFFTTGGRDAEPPTQEEAETYLREAVKNIKNDDVRETLELFVPAMAVAYRKTCGEEASMLDLITDNESNQAQTETAPEPETTDPDDIAGAQAALEKATKPGRDKKSRKPKTGTDDE